MLLRVMTALFMVLVGSCILIATPESAAAQSTVDLDPTTSMHELQVGDTWTFSATVPGVEQAQGWYNFSLGPHSANNIEFVSDGNGNARASVTITITETTIDSCLIGQGWIRLDQTATVYDPTIGTVRDVRQLPCTALMSPQLMAPVQIRVLGCNNDVLQLYNQPYGVNRVPADTGWTNGSRTISYQPVAGVVFSQGTVTSFTFADTDPCIVEPVPLTKVEVCGENNDEIVFPTQPAGVIVSSDTGWINGLRTVILSPAAGYEFPRGGTIRYTFPDVGPCLTDAPIEPTHTKICGIDNDIVHIPDQPANVLVESSGWVNHSITLTFSAAENYRLPDDSVTSYTFADSGLCLLEAPIPPMAATVCGDNNDVITVPTQPVGVVVTSDGAWTNSSWTVTFSAPKGYVLPDGTVTTYTFTDSGPCVTEAPVQPVIDAVCGANNDVVTIPDQPENVVVDSDGAWTDGTWNVTYSAAENYVLPDPAAAAVELKDEDTPCPTDAPVPPVQTTICGSNNDTLTFPEQPEGVSLDTDTGWVDNERTVTFAIAPEFVTDGSLSFTYTDDAVPCPTAIPPTPTPTAVPPTAVPTAPAVTPEPTSTSTATPATPLPTSVSTEPAPTATSTVTKLPETGSGGGNASVMTLALITVAGVFLAGAVRIRQRS